ncbi:uncharacterized protein LOC113385651 [Ctenocephalides felis]|nr:uncharacterized protein LOC113385651 [Ctenocephalides felis]
MWLYLFVSFFWFISSLFLAMSKTRFKRSSKLIVIAWLVITSIVCIMDFILAIFFGLDYQHIHDFQVLNSILGGKPLAMQTAAGLMMAMAMRGFVLWFINACLIAYITTITVLSEKTKMPKQHMQGNTWLYDNISIGGGDFGESKPKGLPKTNPPTSGWASLQELMRRYKIHTPKRSKTPVQDNGQVNNGFQSDPPLQFVYPRVSNDRDFYENSMF